MARGASKEGGFASLRTEGEAVCPGLAARCLRMSPVDVTSNSAVPGVSLAGLSSDEAAVRLRRGDGNRAVSGSSRGYARILRTNVFNLYNTILFGIGGALLALGRYSDALISAGLGVLNAVISAVQEIRAKRQLDRLQLLERSSVLVVRDGRDIEVMAEDVVLGDVVRVRPRDQIVVDGPVLDGAVAVAASLLTGESGTQLRARGRSFCREAAASAEVDCSWPAMSVRLATPAR